MIKTNRFNQGRHYKRKRKDYMHLGLCVSLYKFAPICVCVCVFSVSTYVCTWVCPCMHLYMQLLDNVCVCVCGVFWGFFTTNKQIPFYRQPYLLTHLHIHFIHKMQNYYGTVGKYTRKRIYKHTKASRYAHTHTYTYTWIIRIPSGRRKFYPEIPPQ